MSSQFQIFTEPQIHSLRKGGKILRGCLDHVAALVRPGITTGEIDQAAETYIRDHGGKPAFKGYHGFPATLCISINEEIVHGIPGKRVIKEGDIVSLDGGVIFDELYTDACVTVGAGSIAPKTKAFLDWTSQTLESVIHQIVKAGVHVGDISSFIQKHLESKGYVPVRALTGHGLGSTLHQFPDVPNIGKAGTGPALPVHTLIAIEPIACIGGTGEIVTASDNWTISAQDKALSCHFEHTVFITDEGCKIIA